MQEKIRVHVSYSPHLYGSDKYTVTVEVVNLSDKSLADIKVEALTLPGRTLELQRDMTAYAETKLGEYQEQSIIRELNLQVVEAYRCLEAIRRKNVGIRNNQIGKSSNKSDVVIEIQLLGLQLEIVRSDRSRQISGGSFLKSLRKILLYEIHLKGLHFYPYFELEANSFSDSADVRIPVWAREATKISNLKDVERAEQKWIIDLPEDSFLREAFFANKEKLELIYAENSNGLNYVNRQIELKSGQSSSFTFYCKAPNLFHAKKCDSQFEITYLEIGERGNELVGVKTIREAIPFQASSYAIPYGAFSGGVSGFLVRVIFLSKTDFSTLVFENFWDNFLVPLLGSVLLSWILAIVVRRSEDSKKFITVEDFSGGFFIGALAGLFSQEILEYLRTMLPQSE